MTLVAAAVAAALALAPEPDPRAVEGPGSVQWPADRPEPEPPAPGSKPKATKVPSPRATPLRGRIDVAIGLDPSAPGTKAEKALLTSLEKSVLASTDPPTKVRRLRPGSPDARQICRAGREDLVIMVGYVPDHEDPVLFSHDCRLGSPLGLRGSAAAAEVGLVPALWNEHDELVRSGVRERRRLKGLSPAARGGIIAGVVIVVVGVAVGLLVANALRGETVVLKVSP